MSLRNTCPHQVEITQSHTLAALIRLSTTTHDLLMFSISKISNNSGKTQAIGIYSVDTSGLFFYTRLYASSQIYSHALGGDHISLVFMLEKSIGLG